MAVPKYTVPWWATLQGGQEAADQVAQFSIDPSLASAWRTANQTRLAENPELAAAVTQSNVDYATARRLDAAFQASTAQKQSAIATDAGFSRQMVSPHVTGQAAAADAAQRQAQPAQSAWYGQWGGLGMGLQELGSAVHPILQGGFDLGKHMFENLVKGLRYVSSPVTVPVAAGMANQQDKPAQAMQGDPTKGNIATEGWKDYVGSFQSGFASVWNMAKNLGEGVGEVAGFKSLSDPQKEDMRRAGYNPDEWSSRYAYYFDNSKHATHLAPDNVVKQAKQDYNPYKVDLAREIVTSGVYDNFGKAAGLSPDAQRFLQNLQRNDDPEGSAIMKRLTDRDAVSLGANIANTVPSLKPGTGTYDAVSAIGDLAAYWYVDPLMVAGRALKAYRVAKYGVDVSPDSVKSAIAQTENGAVDGKPLTAIGRRYDDVLDRIDKIHLLRQEVSAENPAAAQQLANEVARFQQTHEDLMPFYDTLVGMRQGSIKGSFFAPARGRSFADPDQMAPIGLNRVDDPKDFAPIFKLRDSLGDEVSQQTRNEARANVAEVLSDAVLANTLAEGRPLVQGTALLPGSVRVSSRVKAAFTPLFDSILGQRGKLAAQIEDAEGKGLIDFKKEFDSNDVTELLTSAEGGQWIRENYTPGTVANLLTQGPRGGLGSRLAMALSRMDTMRNAALLTFDGTDSTQTFSNFVRFFMPRSQTAYLTDAWAAADPARRKVMLEGLFSSLAEARPALQNPAAKDFWRQQLKGSENIVNPGASTMEAYSTPATDLIDTPSGKFAAGMYSTQFSQGVQLPSFIDIVKNTEKLGILSYLSGASNTRVVQQFSRAVKNGYIGTISHMLRHAMEGRGYQWMETPDEALKATVARVGVAGEVSAQRAELNDLVRQARSVLDSGRMDEIQALLHSDRDEYIRRIEQVVRDRTGSEPLAALSRLLGQDALTEGVTKPMAIQDIARLRSQARLMVAWPVDAIRRARANLYGKIAGEETSGEAYDWYDRTLAGLGDKFREGVSRLLSGARDEYAHGGSGIVNEAQQLSDGMQAGQRVTKMKLDNTWGYLGATGDLGAMRWADALGRRLADPVGLRVIHAVAQHALDTAEEVRNARMNPMGIRTGRRQWPRRPAEPGVDVPEVPEPADAPTWGPQTLQPPGYNGVQRALDGIFRNDAAGLPHVQDLWEQAARAAEYGANHPTQHDWIGRVEDLLAQRDAAIHDHVNTQLFNAQHLKTPEDVAHWLLTERPEGEAYRLYGMRGKYVAGQAAQTPEEVDQAMKVWAREMVDDTRYYLGLRHSSTGQWVFEPQQRSMIRRAAADADPLPPTSRLFDDIAPSGAPGTHRQLEPELIRDGKPLALAQDPQYRREVLERVAMANRPAISLDDLAAIPNNLRPEVVQAPVVVGRKFIDLSADGVLQALVDLSNKAYRFTVSGPLERLVHDPQVIAAHHEIMAAQQPLAAELAERGMSPANIYETLEANAYRHAIARVVRYSDNPRTQTYFSLLSNNLLFFERAVEDFFRRFVQVTKADPASLARAHLMVEAGLHSGLLYQQTGKDDEGHDTDEMMFTWPGSGLMMRGINEAARGLGLAKSDVVKTAVWQDFASPVRMMHPAIDNPIGFSTSPLIGASMRVMRDNVFPQHTMEFDKWLTTLEGGARSFGTQSLAESLLPIYGKRLVNLLDADPNAAPGMLAKGRDGQVASAVRNSMIYLSGAGKIPGPNATPSEMQHAQDELRQQAVNNLFLRAVLSTFSPVSAGMGVTDVNDLGAQNIVDQLRSVRSVRGEWFNLLEDMTNKYNGNSSRALSEANIEWLKRDHGSIINPSAFTVGSTRAPGTGNQDKAIPSNLPTTQWMLDHKDFLQKYGEVAYRLIPALGHEYYDTVGYRTQLRTELREHKDMQAFYDDLIYSQASQKYYEAKGVRDELLAKAPDKATKNAIYKRWSSFEQSLEVADPVWAKLRAERDVPGRVHADLAPALHNMLNDEQLPDELQPVKNQLAAMAKLYDEYRQAYTQVTGSDQRSAHARQVLNTLYHRQGDTLFAAPAAERQAEDMAAKYPLDGLWRAMRVYER